MRVNCGHECPFVYYISHMKEKMSGLAVLFFGLVGVADTLYLSVKQSGSVEILPCPVFGSGCADVLHSEYSSFMGIPLADYGVLYYTLIVLFAIVWLYTKKTLYRDVMTFLALVGFFLSLAFIYIQGVLIGTYCFYCVVSAVTATLIFFVMLPSIIDRILDLFHKKIK